MDSGRRILVVLELVNVTVDGASSYDLVRQVVKE